MTLQSFGGFVAYPPHGFSLSAGPSIGSATLDAVDEKLAMVFRAPKSGDIAKLCYRTGTVVTGATLDVRLETVTLATGEPTGTLADTNSNASQVIQDTDDNTFFATSLTSAATVTQGDLLAVVLVAPGSGTFDIDFWLLGDLYGTFPYGTLNTGSWAIIAGSGPLFALEYSDGSYPVVPGVWPVDNILSWVYNNTDTPDVYGNEFQVPYPCRVSGAWIWCDLDATGTVKLISGSSTVEASVALDPDAWNGATGRGPAHLTFDTAVTLAKDTDYKIVLQADSASDLALYYYPYDTTTSPNLMSAVPCGEKVYATEAKAGTWTWADTTNEQAMIGVLIDQFDDGTGGAGGGLITHPGMSGGMRG